MSEKLLNSICEAVDNPLKIGGAEIPCYVLDDESRVLSQRGFLVAIGRNKRTNYRLIKKVEEESEEGGAILPFFIAAKNLQPYIGEDLFQVSNPIIFKTNEGAIAYGYKAELLPKVCYVFIDAKKAGVLLKSQYHIAEQCEILIRGLSEIGIIALVDEATGYQDIRNRKALQAILDKYLKKEFAAWAKTFPDEFYKEVFRLKGWFYDPKSIKRPSVIGKYTNDIIYERLAPGILKELQNRNPLLESGYRKVRHHQYLTEDIGHPALAQHLHAVLALMRASMTWDNFYRLLQRSFPKYGDQIEFEIFNDEH